MITQLIFIVILGLIFLGIAKVSENKLNTRAYIFAGIFVGLVECILVLGFFDSLISLMFN